MFECIRMNCNRMWRAEMDRRKTICIFNWD